MESGLPAGQNKQHSIRTQNVPDGINQARQKGRHTSYFGNLAICLAMIHNQLQTHGFASPPFDGFAIVVMLFPAL
jgi:hypothetical protein